jgi:hypothetical protein
MFSALYDWHLRKSALLAAAGVWAAGIFVAIVAVTKAGASGSSITTGSAEWLYGPAVGETEPASAGDTTDQGQPAEFLPEDRIVGRKPAPAPGERPGAAQMQPPSE